MSTDLIFAAEREAHWDGDLWRSYCGEAHPTAFAVRRFDPRRCHLCTRLTVVRFRGRGVCARCGSDAGTFRFEELNK